jgi:molybdenum cofactor guanylyltransferase
VAAATAHPGAEGLRSDRPLSLLPEASGVVLAGGRSLRMGRDKLPLKIGGVSLLEHVVNVLASRCAEVIVVGGGDVPRDVTGQRVPDLRPGREGPLAGMEAGLSAARHPIVFVAAGDMPFVPGAMVDFLLGRLAQRGLSAVLPRHGGRPQPLCAAYDRAILPRLASALDAGMRSVRDLLGDLEEIEYIETGELRRFGDPDLFLMNVNSPADLRRAREADRRC